MRTSHITLRGRAASMTMRLLLLLVLALPPGCGHPTPPPAVGPNPGALAPDFTVTTVAGATVQLADLRDRPLLINFWATWCAPCKREMPLLQALHSNAAGAAADKSVAVLAVNYGEPPAHVADYVTTAGYTMPVALDPDMNLARSYLIHGMPTSFFIDRAGVVRRVHVGELTSELLRTFIAEVQ